MSPPIFSFPDEPVWNEQDRSLDFTVELGEYRGIVRVPRRVFQVLLSSSPTAERCVAAFHQNRTEFERAVERKIVRRELTSDGQVELGLRDLRPM